MSNIRDYAEKVASYIVDAEIVTNKKNNNVERIGITVRKDDEMAAPIFYVDGYYENETDPKIAALEIIERIEEHRNKIKNNDLDFLHYYEKVRPMLKVRLLNAKNKQYSGISAKKYGYEDLKIVPYIDMSSMGIEGSIVVRSDLVKEWGKDIKTIVNHAIKNCKDDFQVQNMSKFIADRSGVPEEIVKGSFPIEMLIITNKKTIYGAIGAIFAEEYLKQKFPHGYVVLPTSVHEVIVIPNEGNVEEFTEIIKFVNGSELMPEEVLSDHAYLIVA